jgi:hypothetical protein
MKVVDFNFFKPATGLDLCKLERMCLKLSATILFLGHLALSVAGAQELYDFITVPGRYSPNAITVDASNNVFLCDGNYVVRQLLREGTNYLLTTIAGAEGKAGNTDGTNSSALFANVGYIAPAPDGTLFVTDNETIRQLRPFGTNWIVNTIAGVPGITGSADGTNSDIRFSNPHGIAVDKAGAVYVADFENYTIRRLVKAGTNWISSTIAGLAKTPGMDDGTNNFARFVGPHSLTIDADGTLYVADRLDQPNTGGWESLRLVKPYETNWVVSYIENLSWGNVPDFAARSADGLAVGPQRQLYVVSPASATILEIAPHGTNMLMRILAGTPSVRGNADGTNTAATFYGPSEIALDKSGNLLVTDWGTIRIGIRLPPPPPIMNHLFVGNTSFEAQWLGSLGSTYSLQYSPDLNERNWMNIGASISAKNEIMSAAGATPPGEHGFYRVVMLP